MKATLARSEARAASYGSAFSAYLALTKPRVVALLLLTTVASMLVAERGVPSVLLMFVTLFGGFLVAGGAAAFNQYIDREIDDIMFRTSKRPIASGAVTPSQALRFAIAVTVIGLVMLALLVNPLTAVLALIGHIHYAFVYSKMLKRLTPQNIVLGGAAGAAAPLVGWTAVTNSVDLTALYLFAIVFFWTPPHFWALALLIKDQYERAGVPMLPVVCGDEETRRQIVLYTIQMLAVTLLLVAGHSMGPIYLVLALILGGIFIWSAIKLMLERTRERARQLFMYSMLYLTLLFGAMVLDRLVSLPF